MSTYVHLNVGGKRYMSSKTTLTKLPGTMLAIMVEDRWREGQGKSEDDPIMIDRNGRLFEHILEYLRNGNRFFFPDARPEVIDRFAALYTEAHYFGFADLTNAIGELYLRPNNLWPSSMGFRPRPGQEVQINPSLDPGYTEVLTMVARVSALPFGTLTCSDRCAFVSDSFGANQCGCYDITGGEFRTKVGFTCSAGCLQYTTEVPIGGPACKEDALQQLEDQHDKRRLEVQESNAPGTRTRSRHYDDLLESPSQPCPGCRSGVEKYFDQAASRQEELQGKPLKMVVERVYYPEKALDEDGDGESDGENHFPHVDVRCCVVAGEEKHPPAGLLLHVSAWSLVDPSF